MKEFRSRNLHSSQTTTVKAELSAENIIYAKVAACDTLYSYDKEFDYEIPEDLLSKAKAGCRVKIPFGKGNRDRIGMILSLSTEKKHENVKPIKTVLDKEPLLSAEMISLVKWMQERYFCTFYDAINTILPAGIRYKMKTVLSKGDTEPRDDIETEITAFLNKSPCEMSSLIQKFSVDELYILGLIKSGVLKERSETVRAVSDATKKSVRALDYSEPLTDKQELALSCLQDLGEMSVKELCYYSGVSVGVINTLVKKGAAELFDAPFFRNPYADITDAEPSEVSEIDLSEEQQNVYDKVLQEYNGKKKAASLLFGVTGSGKTSVYLKLIDKVLSDGRSVIVMVPEISLTPQTVKIFHEKYGKRVAVFHSGLSIGERLDEWKRVKCKDADIVVGTRSAIFAPLDDLGLIVIDEEHEYTYKSEQSPKYHARDIAKFRSAYNNALLLLSSATPAVESMYYAKTGKYSLYTLKNRYGDAILPQIKIVDMNEERLAGNASQYSFTLQDAIAQRLSKGEQSILLLNRRGFNTFAICTSCKEVVTCPRCSISLTFHSANNRLICHYCGYSREETDVCPTCGKKSLSYRGFGTQRAEKELTELFPSARVLRIDTDSAMTRTAFEKYMSGFRNQEYDILVGTQMVAKGLDFEKVTLAAVLSADQSLYAEDFRSNERAFDLFVQVVGRAGRGRFSGEAVIQTFTPESHIIELSQTGDYESFYNDEISYRKSMLYPPFSDFCVITFSGAEETITKKCAEDFLVKFSETAQNEYPSLPLRVLNPTAATVAVVNNKFRYKLLIKCRNTKEFRVLLSGLLSKFMSSSLYKGISISADINPDIVI